MFEFIWDISSVSQAAFLPRKRPFKKTEKSLSYIDGRVKILHPGETIHLGYRFHFASARDAPVIVLFHGNAEIAEDYTDIYPEFDERLGVSLLVFDYRGYGWSDGEPKLTKLCADAEGIADQLTDLIAMNCDFYYARKEQACQSAKLISRSVSKLSTMTCHSNASHSAIPGLCRKDGDDDEGFLSLIDFLDKDGPLHAVQGPDPCASKNFGVNNDSFITSRKRATSETEDSILSLDRFLKTPTRSHSCYQNATSAHGSPTKIVFGEEAIPHHKDDLLLFSDQQHPQHLHSHLNTPSSPNQDQELERQQQQQMQGKLCGTEDVDLADFVKIQGNRLVGQREGVLYTLICKSSSKLSLEELELSLEEFLSGSAGPNKQLLCPSTGLRPAIKMFLYGRSIGAVSAVHLATSPKHAGLFSGVIIESGLMCIKTLKIVQVRVEEFARMAYFPLGKIVNYLPEPFGISSYDKLRSLTMPTLLLHGKIDEIVDVEQASLAYENTASDCKRLKIFKRAGHNNLIRLYYEDYFQSLRDFLEMTSATPCMEDDINVAAMALNTNDQNYKSFLTH